MITGPGANVIEAVDCVQCGLPRRLLPASVDMRVSVDRTTTIRASVREIERTLLIATGLVVVVVFVFLRRGAATFIPGIAVPLSLLGTFGVMWFLGYSLNNLSLMALTISTGFVVDDAIVVMENITRRLEHGATPVQAAIEGAREIGFTVVAMSISLVAVFIPLLFMGGLVGRLFREFAVTLSVAVAISLVISLTTTPMLCARLLRVETDRRGRFDEWSERIFRGLLRGYEITLAWALRRRVFTLSLLPRRSPECGASHDVPKGSFRSGTTAADRHSGRAGDAAQHAEIRARKGLTHPAVDTIVAFSGGVTAPNRASPSSRRSSARDARADEGSRGVTGIRPHPSAVPSPDLRVGGSSGRPNIMGKEDGSACSSPGPLVSPRD